MENIDNNGIKKNLMIKDEYYIARVHAEKYYPKIT